MPVPGYDPDDLDEQLSELATDSDLERMLTDEERRAYENGEEGLFDLLSEADIEEILRRRDVEAADS
jgi:hypothetical protein